MYGIHWLHLHIPMHLSSSRWCLPFLCMASCDVKSAMPWCLRCQGVRPFRPARKQRTVPGCSTFVARPEIPANTRVFGPRVFSPSDPPGNIGLFTRCVSRHLYASLSRLRVTAFGASHGLWLSSSRGWKEIGSSRHLGVDSA